MGHHDGADSRIDCRTKRNQLNGVQSIAVHIDFRQTSMRINGRVAVTGKMFGRRNHSALFAHPR